MLSTALAFADLDGKVCNNTSVVLFLEWKGKRLLFGGDAEWDGAFKKGTKANCSWNVMWNLRKDKLNGALDFYKVRHHGSVNATPWGQTAAAREGEPLAILNAILPEASKAKARGGRFDPPGQLSNDSAHGPSRGNRQTGIEHQELRCRFQGGKGEDLGSP
jgi:hypothetical protein